MVSSLSRLLGQCEAHNYATIDNGSTDKTANATKPSSTFFISPAQLWIGSLISRVNKSGEIEKDWLPRFKRTATKLRALYEPLKNGKAGFRPFLMQFEIGGMLILGALLEVGLRKLVSQQF